MDTLEKIYKNIEKLYDVDSDLIDILAVSGRDSETKYTNEYLDMLVDMKSLQEALHAVLDNHNDTINDIEYALEPLPIKPTRISNQPALDALADEIEGRQRTDAQDMVQEALGAAKRTERALY